MEPGEARGVELGDQIATEVELPGDGTEAGGRRCGGHARVAVSTRTDPPVSV